MANAIATLDQANFAEELATADKPVLVDFWAEWCGPCRALEPVLKEVAAENLDKITVAKVNVDENPDIARQFDIMSIPTLIVFQNGQPVHRFQGASGKAGMLQQLDQFL
ncbi:MAG: thioredoxin [Microthrixaceae bacterium]|jgi:thioredoxin 1|nr:thioredoxin [Microthrixaceae bacterium]